MIHLGDITKIKGNEVPIVDCAIGGSPCQDLSMAGFRKGFDGERSVLYTDQIRIIKEMREYDRNNGRTGVDIRPRYMVWENVPGAFSTNGGKDFAAVLEEAVHVAEPEAPSVSVPEKGWPTSGCIYDELGNWSVAWRVLDAQFWETSDKPLPQRRRRIALVADFGGLSAPEILFVRKSVSGDIAPGEPKREEAPGETGVSSGAASYAIQGSMIGIADKNGPQGDGINEDVSFTLNTTDRHAVAYPNTYQRVTGPLMANSHPGSYTGQDAFSDMLVAGLVEVPRVAHALRAKANCDFREDSETYIVSDVDCRNATELPEQNITLQSSCNHNLNSGGIVRVKRIVRRLTPLECERLQGFPDNWTLIGEPFEEDVPDYVSVYDESKYVAPRLEDFGLTEDDLNRYALVDDEDIYDDDDAEYDNYLEYLDACDKAKSKATKRVKVGSHKEVNYYYTDSNGKRKKVSDSARYKALGNSIALPPWKWVLKRLCACYERDATMASLFDGIGGFPLIWEQINGKGSCLWASEIDEFPIAVTKARFSE